jgi:Bacterial Ig-like domain (group 3)
MRDTRVFGVLAAAVVGALLAVAPPATAATDTTTALVSSANPSGAGQAVTLTATVTGDSPTGQVVFGDTAGYTIAVVDLSGGVASTVVSSLGVGAHGLTATYSGDAGNNFSMGSLTQTVNAPPAPPAPVVKAPTVKLAASTTKASVGDKVVLRWHSKNADSVQASGDWNGSQKPKGSAAVRIAERGKHVFKLTVQNAAGAKTATVTVMAARKAKTLELVVTEELTMVGSEVSITADGLAKGEDYTIRLDGKPLFTGKADKHGDVARTFVLAKTTPEGALPLTITGSNPNRVGSAILSVIKPKKLLVEVADPEANKTSTQTITVTGLLAGETVTVMYKGKKINTGAADDGGLFTYEFNVGKKAGVQTVKVIGADPSRSGTVTFTVLDQVGGGGGGGGGEPPPSL